MDARRLAYLKAMGIDVWVPRDRPSQPVPPTEPPPCAEPTIEPPRVEPLVAAVANEPASEPLSVLDWEALQRRVSDCRLCELAETRTQTVFGVGNREADWLIIGEAPGADEDRQGEPFVGRAGRLLNNMLLAVGLRRETVYIANILKCRPPGNRDPRPEETGCCRPYLTRQIELIAPRLILVLGRIAAHTLLDTKTPLGKLRGSVYRYQDTDVPMVVTYHPAYLLRNPADKSKAWEDLKFALRVAAPGGGGSAT